MCNIYAEQPYYSRCEYCGWVEKGNRKVWESCEECNEINRVVYDVWKAIDNNWDVITYIKKLVKSVEDEANCGGSLEEDEWLERNEEKRIQQFYERGYYE